MNEESKRKEGQKYYSDKEFEQNGLSIMGKFSNIDEHQTPTIIVVGKNNKGEPKAMELDLTTKYVDWTDHDSKAQALRSAGQSYFNLFKGDYAPFAVFMVTEAWGKFMQADKDGNPPKITKPVREYKDKQEMMIISSLTLDGRSKFTYTNIERLDDKEDGKIRLGEFVAMGKGGDEGYEDNLLPHFYRGFGDLYLGKAKRND